MGQNGKVETIEASTTSGALKTEPAAPIQADVSTTQEQNCQNAQAKETEPEAILGAVEKPELQMKQDWMDILQQAYEHCIEAGLLAHRGETTRNGETVIVAWFQSTHICQNCKRWLINGFPHECQKPELQEALDKA